MPNSDSKYGLNNKKHSIILISELEEEKRGFLPIFCMLPPRMEGNFLDEN
jgi:hypothetical protein